ncbi:MAG: carboxypeptidase-like regulatory domain-containing protein [Planctomycetes bacterium]|nr:carboxypeptidase-like regulatory domain-containing protein [Planctomycetota bacterium]
MSSKPAILLFLAVGCAAAAAWFWWQESSAPPIAPPPPVEPLPAGGGELSVPPPRPLPPDALRVRLTVLPRERYLPPPVLPVQAVRAGDGVALPTAPIAGVGAGFDGGFDTGQDRPATATGVAMVRIDTEHGAIVRQVAIDAGQVAQPPIGAPLVVTGVIRDANGKPLPEASVWFGEYAADGARREFVTDQDGAYRALVLASGGVPFVASGRGHATVWRTIAVAMPMAPCDAQLHPGCTLEVQLVAAAAAMDAGRVFVVPGASVTTEMSTWPFFVQALDDGARLDANGRTAVSGLPRGAEVGIVVRHPAAALAAPVAAVLKGERNQVQVPLVLREASWRGRVVDGDGQPLFGVSLWSRPAGRPLRGAVGKRLLPPHLDAVGTCATSTDVDGAFVIGRAPGDEPVLSLRGRGFAGRDVPLAEVELGAPLQVPVWLGGEPQFELAPPRAGASWFAETDLSGGLRAELAADASWRVSLPYAGRFDVELRTFVGSTGGEPRVLRDVAITGPVSLQSPPPPR